MHNNIQIPILYNFTELGLVSKLTSLGNQSKFIQLFLHIKKTKSHACSKTPLNILCHSHTRKDFVDFFLMC